MSANNQVQYIIELVQEDIKDLVDRKKELIKILNEAMDESDQNSSLLQQITLLEASDDNFKAQFFLSMLNPKNLLYFSTLISFIEILNQRIAKNEKLIRDLE